MNLVWNEFVESPTLSEYQTLKSHADTIHDWASWRGKALDYLRQRIADKTNKPRKDRWAVYRDADHSELVRIFLWEKDIETAWREAQKGGCSNNLWLELAAKREAEYPEEVLPIFQRQIEPTLDRKNNDAYKEALGFLRKMRNLMNLLNRASEFTGYANKLRAVHKAKRNFIKLLDQERI
jgi:uncharacterized Zn finger protein